MKERRAAEYVKIFAEVGSSSREVLSSATAIIVKSQRTTLNHFVWTGWEGGMVNSDDSAITTISGA